MWKNGVKNDFNLRSAVWTENQELIYGHIKFEMETRYPFRAVGEGLGYTIPKFGGCLDERYKYGSHWHRSSICLSLGSPRSRPWPEFKRKQFGRRVLELPVEKRSETRRGRESVKGTLWSKLFLLATEFYSHCGILGKSVEWASKVSWGIRELGLLSTKLPSIFGWWIAPGGINSLGLPSSPQDSPVLPGPIRAPGTEHQKWGSQSTALCVYRSWRI